MAVQTLFFGSDHSHYLLKYCTDIWGKENKWDSNKNESAVACPRSQTLDLKCEAKARVIDCEQSLFFFRFSKGSARARASVKRRRRENEGGSPSSRLRSRAWSFACLGRFARRTKKKERLLVVYAGNYFWKNPVAENPGTKILLPLTTTLNFF